MTEQLTTTRASRNRRLVAVAIWGGLVLAAGILWNARQLGHVRSVPAETVAFLLSAFAALVSVFAWMLFNPNRRAANESPMLLLAGAVTLLPPCIIGFCLMPPESVLRGWLAFGLLAIVIIAVLSPIPEEFFAVPRARSSYFQPAPEMEIPDEWIFVTETNWLKEPGIRNAVPNTPRPSLAPNAYRGRTGDERNGLRLTRADRIAERRRRKAEQRNAEAEPIADELVLRDNPASRRSGFDVRKGSERVGKAGPDSPPRERATPLQPVPEARPQPSLPVTDFEPARKAEQPPLGFRSQTQLPSAERVEHQAHDKLAAPLYERYKDETGSELVEGTVIVRFERGQKRAHLHVPFSPPLDGTPEVECETIGDVPLRLKVPVKQSYGLRIEARRSNADEPAETEIGFAAIYSPRTH